MSRIGKDSPAKKWVIRHADTDTASAVLDISQELGIHPIVAELLCQRGYKTLERAKQFLTMETERLWDPLSMKDMDKAVERIQRAIRQGERILIFGDYDVDGVTSVCTAYLYLKSKGADVLYYIPNRSGEGHGVSKEAIDRFKKEGTKLIITVDTGITAGAEVEYAKTVGVDFVVTDHHECHADIPQACAVVNPCRLDCEYPFKELAGVGVVFKLICAIERETTGKHLSKCVGELCYYYGDLVAIGTIADVMPIIDENRLIVAYGLKRIAESPRLGLRSLIQASTYRYDRKSGENVRTNVSRLPKINTGYIGYTIAPRINAAGRIKTASLAVELFLTDREDYANHLAELLCDANRERQAEENRITEEAFEIIDREYDVANNPFIVLSSDRWHHGVIGIVASRITEKYGLPCMLISFDCCESDVMGQEDMGKGSGRSVKGINLVEALCTCSHLLPKFGGHELAAGLSIKRCDVKALKEALCDYARKTFAEQPIENIVEADGEIRFEDISMKLVQDLQRLEPFGTGNTAPVFVVSDVLVKEANPITGGKHTKLVVGNSRSSLTAMCFSTSPESLGVGEGDRADILFSMDINEFNGRKSVQMIVRDIRISSHQTAAEQQLRDRYTDILAGAHFTVEEDIVPTRRDFADVYCFFRQNARSGIENADLRTILHGLLKHYGNNMNYIKLKFIIKILQEMNVLGIEETEAETYRFQIHYKDEKVDLEKSNILKRLRSQQS